MHVLPLQDYLFRLVPGYVDSGKGKCSYDPKQENIAVLISKTCFIYWPKNTKYYQIPYVSQVSSSYLPIVGPLQMVTYMQGSISTS